MKKETIIHFAWYAAPYGGSFINQMIELKKRVSELGYQFLLVLPLKAEKEEWCQELIKNEIMRIKFIKDNLSKKDKIKEIKKIVEKEKTIIVHSHFGMIENELLFVCKKKRIPFIYHSRASLPKANNLKSKIKYMIKYFIFYHKVYIIGLNKDMEQQLKEYRFNMNFYTEIPETIDFERFNKTNNRFSKKDLGLSEKDNITLMMGYDIKIKGVDIAVKAFNQIHDKKYKLLVVMAKDKEKNLEQIKEMCNGKIPDYLIVLDPIENIGDYYKITNQFLSASRTEGFSNSILEALYLKKKVIISDIPGVSWAKKYKSVTTYNVDNSNELKGCITNSKTILEEELQEIQTEIKNKYSVDVWIRNIIKLYKKILDGENNEKK